jgi:hypothetical protein
MIHREKFRVLRPKNRYQRAHHPMPKVYAMKGIVLRAVGGVVVGLAFGVLQLVAIGAAERVNPDYTSQPLRSANPIFVIANAPARGLSYIWTDVLKWPPHSELAWVLVPVVTMLIQWGLIGFAAGLWWGLRSASGK